MKEWLDRFMGLDHGEKLGLRAGGELVYGEFEGGHSHETKISAVHFVRFRPTPAMVSALSDQAVRVARPFTIPDTMPKSMCPGRCVRNGWRISALAHNAAV